MPFTSLPILLIASDFSGCLKQPKATWLTIYILLCASIWLLYHGLRKTRPNQGRRRNRWGSYDISEFGALFELVAVLKRLGGYGELIEAPANFPQNLKILKEKVPRIS